MARLLSIGFVLALVAVRVGVAQPCVLVVPQPAVGPYGPSGTSGSFQLNFNQAGCVWSVSSDQSWFVLSAPTSGTASGTSVTINYTLMANSGSAPRTGLLSWIPSFNGDTGTEIQQNSSNCTFSLSPPTATVPASGGTSSTISFDSSPPGCWAFRSYPPWAGDLQHPNLCPSNTI